MEAVREIISRTMSLPGGVTATCCDICGGELEIGLTGLTFCRACLESAEAEREAIARKERVLCFERSGIPPKYWGANFSHCDPGNPAVVAVMRWSRRPEGIVLIHGKCGRGKTYLAAAAKRELNLSGAGSNFVCEDEVLLTIKSAFGNDATTTEKGAYRQYTMSWPLIIDDIGISRVTDFTLDVWETIIGRRYRNDYPTLLTSNYGLDDLIKRVGDRVVDRIRESKQVVEYVGENRRII